MKNARIIEELNSTGKFRSEEIEELQELEKGDLLVFLALYSKVENKNKVKFILRGAEIMKDSIRQIKIEGNDKLLEQSYSIVSALSTEIRKVCEYLEDNGIDANSFMELFEIVEDEDYEYDAECGFYENLIPTSGSVGYCIRCSLIRAESIVKSMMNV